MDLGRRRWVTAGHRGSSRAGGDGESGLIEPEGVTGDRRVPGGLGGVVSEVLRQVQSSGHSSSHSGYGKPYKKKSLMSELFG